MAAYCAPLEDIRFVLEHQLDATSVWRRLVGMEDVDMDTADAILEEVGKLAREQLAPLNRPADEAGCVFADGCVTTPAGFKAAYRLFNNGGWGALSGNPAYGGMGMPKSLVAAAEEMIQGSCMAFGLAPMLTAGACLALDAHASEALKALYLPKMYAGEWAGAMDLTEPQAGSDLGLLRTRAEPDGADRYRLTGTKIFITWGEHDMAENIVHLVLARLPDAPPGTRGISMFLVPKFLPDDNGEPGERNAVYCGAIEKKMGIKASATCVMNYDGAIGWLVGEPHRGLAAMFTMMNYERLVVGIQGMAVAEVSYQNAVNYARERLQSRALSGARHPGQAADPLMVHGDIRRMLMTMRAYNEGGRAFYLYVAQWLDLARYGNDDSTQRHAQDMVALLTPVVKAFLTDRALDTALLGQQIFGGHGYVREAGQEQLVRDIRITQIYEGTNGIQAMDLVCRKTAATGGALLQSLLTDIRHYIDSLDTSVHSALSELTLQLQEAMTVTTQATDALLAAAQSDPEALGVAAVDYLDLLGYLCLGYMWLRAAGSGGASSLYESKVACARFYMQHLLPHVHVFYRRIVAGPDAVMQVQDEWF